MMPRIYRGHKRSLAHAMLTRCGARLPRRLHEQPSCARTAQVRIPDLSSWLPGGEHSACRLSVHWKQLRSTGAGWTGGREGKPSIAPALVVVVPFRTHYNMHAASFALE